MPWSGSSPNQSFSRTDGTRSGTQVWQEADAAGVDILDTDHDTHDQDIADAINATLKKDGGNAATADLPMGGNKHTNVGDAAAKNQYLTLGQRFNGVGIYVDGVGGTADAITLTTGFSISAYVAGQTFQFLASATNTGAATVNLDSLGVKSITRRDGSALVAGDLIAGAVATITYDGTGFQLGAASAASADVLARILPIGSIIISSSASPASGYVRLGEAAQTLQKDDYPEGYAYAVAEGWTTTATTFDVPKAAGYFLRFAGTTNAIDPDGPRAVGSTQADAYKAHSHTAGSLGGSTNTTGAHDHTVSVYFNSSTDDVGGTGAVATSSTTNRTTSTNGNHSHSLNISGSTASSGGDETRGINVAYHADMLLNPAAAAASQLGVYGLQYTFDAGTAETDPGAGLLKFDNAAPSSVTEIYISSTDGLGVNVDTLLKTFDDSTSTIRGRLDISKVGISGTFASFHVTGATTDNTGWLTLAVTPVDDAGAFAASDNLAVKFFRTGDKGTAGGTANAGIVLAWSDSTSDADPGAGGIAASVADLSSDGTLYVNDTDQDGNDISAVMLLLDDGDNGSTVTLVRSSDQATAHIQITAGSAVDATGYTKLDFVHVGGATDFAADDEVVLWYALNGANGADGAGAGDVTAASAFGTDNRLIRSDGTGKGVQASNIAVDDSGNVSGVQSIAVATVAELTEISTPSAPGAGKVYLYAKADGLIYSKDDAGTETLVSGGAGGSGGGGAAPNLIINGDFSVGQRGTSFTSTSTPANSDDNYLLDRWILLSDGNDIADVSQETTAAQLPTGGRAAIKLDVETANKKFGIFQPVEYSSARGLQGGVASLSFKAKIGGSNATLDTIRAAVVNWSGTADTITSDCVSGANWNAEGTDPTLATNWTYESAPSNLTVTSSWQTFTIENISIDTASGTNIGVFIWVNNSDATAGDLLYITDVKLELGATATDYHRPSLQQTLDACQRYYYKTYEIATAPGTATETGMIAHRDTRTPQGDKDMFATRFPTPMRTTPTVTFYSTSTGSSGKIYDVHITAGDVAATSITGTSTRSSGWPTGITGATASGNLWKAQLTAEAEL